VAGVEQSGFLALVEAVRALELEELAEILL
jgi:hypothetical protein